MSIRPLSSLKVSTHYVPSHSLFPNTSATTKPLYIYHSVFPSPSTSSIYSHLKATKVIVPAWTYTMYSTDHFHSTTHEVLCVARGAAKLCFGGRQNPERVEIEATAGDVMIVPAGMTHSLVEDLGSFQMVGSYPSGHDWDMCYGHEDERDKVDSIKDLEWFNRDPIYGDTGPVLEN